MNLRKLGVISVLLIGALLSLPVDMAHADIRVTIPAGSGNNASSPAYTPNTITVVIGVNNTVTWVNIDTVPHTVTPSRTPSPTSWQVGSGNMDPKQAYSFTFTVPGTYEYACAYHGWMHGTVLVKSPSTVPEFPAGSIALVLFITIVAVVLVAPRLRAGTSTIPKR